MENSSENPDKKKPVKKGNVPAADIDFGALISTIGEKWLLNPWLTLLWLTVAKFVADAAKYNADLAIRLNKGANRPQTGNTLEHLEQEMDSVMAYVKNYIQRKYKKANEKAYYASFGFVHQVDHWEFPTDRNRRVASLKLMAVAIKENGFQDEEYGQQYWDKMLTDYEALVKQSTTIDGEISLKVGEKNILKKDLTKGVRAIAGVIKHNHPDDYKQVLRDWGFQKEKY
ncbi:hypothetical protein [Flavobacterium sp. SM2513]|uniref:hypothetical protein n=1 Tax=Flavobacterium sp. SM2513 TaxID=3424766 RepID=UPI003D7FA576